MQGFVQVQGTRAGDAGHLSALQMLRAVAARGGVPALYHGTAITLLRDSPSYGLYFVLYEVRQPCGTLNLPTQSTWLSSACQP